MTEKYTFFLRGKMVAEEPLTVTHKDTQIGKVHRLPTAGKGPEARPYWPASNIRGAFRHSIAEVITRAVKNAGASLGLNHHFMLAQGTDIDGAITDGSNVIDRNQELRDVNPGLSLLGRWALPSKLEVGNAYPVTNDCVAMYGQGARRIMFEVQPDLVEELNDGDQQRLMDLISWQSEASGEKGDIKAEIRELNSQLKAADTPAQQRLIKDQLSALKEREKVLNKGEEGATGIRRPLPGYEAFNAGTEFSHNVTLHNVTLLEAGLFIAGLVKFVRYPQLGAKSAYNNGKVAFEWDVARYENERSLEPSVTGSLNLSCTKGVQLNDDLLTKAYNIWCEAEDSLEDAGVDFKRLV